MNEPIVLGKAETATERDLLRGGQVEVRSRRGLRRVERLLIEALPEQAPQRFLTGLDREGVIAIAARRLWPEAEVRDLQLDAWEASLARQTIERAGAELSLDCDTDLPGAQVPGEPDPAAGESFDLIALPLPRDQETILSRELIEEAHLVLRPKGRLLAATDQKGGGWLKKVIHEVFGRASVLLQEKKGMVIVGKRTRERAEVRDHRHLIQATLRERELALESRPGIFGHARLDAGTRALAAAFEAEEGQRVLDLGCGYGPLTLAAAQEVGPQGSVLGVDCSARAVTQTLRNAARNQLPQAHALLRADLEDLDLDAPVDLVLANPPYYSNFRIARAFVGAAERHLRPGGALWMVAKAAQEHAALLGEGWEDVQVLPADKGYGIVHATWGGPA